MFVSLDIEDTKRQYPDEMHKAAGNLEAIKFMHYI